MPFEIDSIVAVVMTYNEAPNVERTLKSIYGLCPIVVVDSGSTDETEAICRKYTEHFLVHPYANHSSQWQWALENLPIKSTWFLALDADFVVSKELRDSIVSDLAKTPADVDGIYVKHQYVFAWNAIRFTGTKRYWLRIVRLVRASVDLSDLVDFRFTVPGKTIEWNKKFTEYNVHDEDISTWMKKQDKFSVRLAVEEELRRRSMLDWEKKPSIFGNSDSRITWLRDRWLSIPLFIRPIIYFFYRYVLSLGFLDGRAGFLYHFLQGFWLRLIVDWKIMQIRHLKLSDAELTAFRNQMLKSPSGSVRDIASLMQLES